MADQPTGDGPGSTAAPRPVVLGVLTETRAGERRVALVPETTAELTDRGLVVLVQAGAGRHAYATDDAYRQAGARVVTDPDEIVASADLLLAVSPPEPALAGRLPAGSVVVGQLQPTSQPDLIRALRDSGVASFALELVPRISRAQAMDVLSSQALVAGYRAVLVAAERLPKFFPLFMTAAGTVPPARVLVLGAGVAGLQAIATARRLGAIVEAYDVRAAAAEEVRSLGATFVELELETQEGTGGYAAAQSDTFLARQRELIGTRVAASDVVVTTAAVPGRRAPLLVTGEMVEAMRPGSVVVDLAAETGGNCELSRPGEEFHHGEVLVWGGANVPSQLPVHASKLYSANLGSFLKVLIGDGGVVRADEKAVLADEILDASCVTLDGTVRHGPTAALLQPDTSGGVEE